MPASTRKSKRLDIASMGTILVTVILFVVALFEKGLTHDMLLEAGVFLVSVKLILSSAKTDLLATRIEARLDELQDLVESLKSK